MAICPIICSIYYLERVLMHDVACEFACAVGCAETISANVLNITRDIYYWPVSAIQKFAAIFVDHVFQIGVKFMIIEKPA